MDDSYVVDRFYDGGGDVDLVNVPGGFEPPRAYDPANDWGGDIDLMDENG